MAFTTKLLGWLRGELHHFLGRYLAASPDAPTRRPFPRCARRVGATGWRPLGAICGREFRALVARRACYPLWQRAWEAQRPLFFKRRCSLARSSRLVGQGRLARRPDPPPLCRGDRRGGATGWRPLGANCGREFRRARRSPGLLHTLATGLGGAAPCVSLAPMLPRPTPVGEDRIPLDSRRGPQPLGWVKGR